MRRTQLSVNLNKIALLRNSREGNWPDPVYFGRLALEAGASGITIHPRPDQRHIRTSDIEPLVALTQAHKVELNMEGNPFENLMPLVRQYRPQQVTFVPDSTDQLTSDHGFNLHDQEEYDRLGPVIEEAKSLGCRVSLFMDPYAEDMELARQLGADRVELYTEGYAAAYDTFLRDNILQGYIDSTVEARRQGLEVNAGHDLSLKNLEAFLKGCAGICEVSIGHALTAEALQYGMQETISRYAKILARTEWDETAELPERTEQVVETMGF